MSIPSMKLHAHSGQYRVWLSGRYVYLGADRGAARPRYDRAIAEWLARGRSPAAHTLRVRDIIGHINAWAKSEYRVGPNGNSEANCIKAAMAMLEVTATVRLPKKPSQSVYIPDLPADDFTRLHLKGCREIAVQRRRSRRYINAQINRIKRCFGQAHEDGLVEKAVIDDITRLAGIRAGSPRVRDLPKTKAVPQIYIDKVLKHVSPMVAAVIKVQLHTGMRINETLQMRVGNLNTAGELWLFDLGINHKTSLGVEPKIVMIGPLAQSVLSPWLDKAMARRDLRAPIWPSDANESGVLKSASVRKAIVSACDVTKTPQWTTHQLRKNKATSLVEREILRVVKSVTQHQSDSSALMYADMEAMRREMTLRHG